MPCPALAKHARPYTDYVWLCDVDERKGLGVGAAYCNDKQARLFTHPIAEVAREKIRDDVVTAKFLSLISDGSTNSAALEAETVYVRYAHRGAILMNFAGYVNVESKRPRDSGCHFNSHNQTGRDGSGLATEACWFRERRENAIMSRPGFSHAEAARGPVPVPRSGSIAGLAYIPPYGEASPRWDRHRHQHLPRLR